MTAAIGACLNRFNLNASVIKTVRHKALSSKAFEVDVAFKCIGEATHFVTVSSMVQCNIITSVK